MSRANYRYYEAISALFPAWEEAFASVARYYLPRVDQELRERLEQFIQQEQAHAKAHIAFNKRRGLTGLEEQERQKTAVIHRRPSLKLWLGTMVSIEHLAACMSRYILSTIDGQPGKEVALFCWHAREELSHKDVAMDVWLAMGYPLDELHKICKQNQQYVLQYIFRYIKQDMKWSDWKDYLDWRLAFQLEVVVPYRAIFKESFHPSLWDDEQYMRAA